MAKYTELAQEIVELIGGKDNVNNAWHCVTRLRFNMKDNSKVKMDDIKNLKGVMGAQYSGDQFQIIIGNDVQKVYGELEQQLGHLKPQETTSKENKSLLNTLMETISGIFTPIIPALSGLGYSKGY